jgi:pSer/pThr/pTyr-binding forkhead associated (FHA) protein
LPLNFTMLARSALNDPEGFLVQVRAPLLIWETPPAQAHELAWVTQPGLAPERSSASEPLIFEVRKGVHARPTGLGFGITVGRAANNDIMLDDPTVSRFHASFQQEPRTGVWHLQDAESQNGTFVDEARVDARIPAPLANGTRLRFGEVRVLFLLPEAFGPWVQSRTAEAGG